MNATTHIFRPDPAQGRTYTAERVVRTTDVVPSGRLRLDSFARYLQAVAEDDLADSALDEPDVLWRLRRCVLAIRRFPQLGDRVSLRTFCSGTGPRWAERTTTLAAGGTDLMQATAVWAAVDGRSGRPVTLSQAFDQVYGASTDAHLVTARLSHPRPGPDAQGRSWPLRAVDFDVAGHVNNAVHWVAVEDVLAGLAWLPGSAEVEYHRPIAPGHEPRLVSSGTADRRAAWLMDGTRVLASAALRCD